ncbi:hypothetical protein BT69DRAFT_626388 [Atractiella rhizophila]|nr:hypothetical protein BT69DRAFT_626388 [Atractiella rhizophila]
MLRYAGMVLAGRFNSSMFGSFYLLDRIDGSLAMSSLILFLLYVTLICRRLLAISSRLVRLTILTILSLSLLVISILCIINISLVVYIASNTGNIFVGFRSVSDSRVFVRTTRGLLAVAIGDLAILLVLCAKVGWKQKSEKTDLAIVALACLVASVHAGTGYIDPSKALIYTRKSLFLVAYFAFCFGSIRRNKPQRDPADLEAMEEKLTPVSIHLARPSTPASFVQTTLAGAARVPQIQFQGVGRVTSWGGLSATLRSPVRYSVRTDRTGSWQYLSDTPAPDARETLQVPKSATNGNFLRFSSPPDTPRTLNELHLVDSRQSAMESDATSVVRKVSKGQRVRLRTGSLKSFKGPFSKTMDEPSTPLPSVPDASFIVMDDSSRPLSLGSLTSASDSTMTTPTTSNVSSARQAVVIQRAGHRVQSFQALQAPLTPPPNAKPQVPFISRHRANPSQISSKFSSGGSNIFTELAREEGPTYAEAFVASPEQVYNPYRTLLNKPIYFPPPPGSSASNGNITRGGREEDISEEEAGQTTPTQDKFISINLGDGASPKRSASLASSKSSKSSAHSSRSSGSRGSGRVPIATAFSGRGSRRGSGMATASNKRNSTLRTTTKMESVPVIVNVIPVEEEQERRERQTKVKMDSFPLTPEEATYHQKRETLGIAIVR